MSPHVGKPAENGITATLNGANSNPQAVFGATNTTRDSFLNYFFGKDGVQSSAALPQPSSHQNRQANHPTEPSISQSIRRSELRSPVMPPDDFAAPPEYGNELFQFVRLKHPLHIC